MSLLADHPVDFEPSLVADRTYESRRRRTRVDVVMVLTLTICLLFILPGALIVPNLTFAGRPGLLVALLLCAWWLISRLHPRLVMTGPQPIRWVAFAYLTATLVSYIAGLVRGLPPVEAKAQNFALLELFEFFGIMLMMADGIPNWERLKGVLRVFVWCSGFMAVTGLAQAILKIDIAHYLTVPGLEFHGGLVGFENRGAGGQFRVAGTAQHYIEFSAVMAMAAPYAIHLARYTADRRQRRWFAVIAVLIAAAVPISISRTGIAALGIMLLVVLPTWRWRLRYNIIAFGVIMSAVLMVVRPGLLGTLRGMFFNSEEDPSIQGRTQDYASVSLFFHERPWLGRGPRTLVPEDYGGLVLDNQWLYSLVTVGVLGVAVLMLLHIVCVSLAAIAYKRATRDEDRHLCAVLISTQLIAAFAGATFDSMYYTTFTSTLALMAGACGAVWRFTHPARTVRTSTVKRFAD